MGKLIKVTLEYDDHIAFVEGEEAKKWQKNADATVINAHIHHCRPFETNPIKWKTKKKKLTNNKLKTHI